jgi:hypothetical protein
MHNFTDIKAQILALQPGESTTIPNTTAISIDVCLLSLKRQEIITTGHISSRYTRTKKTVTRTH